MEVRAHILVSGMVQGVGFRYFVFSRAIALNLLGYVKNLPDGRVEVEVEARRSMIEELINQLKVGPRSAHVSDVMVHWAESKSEYRQFDIR